MVAFNAAQDLPPNITTVEQLHYWCSLVLTRLHFQQEIQEAPGVIEKVAIAQDFPVVTNAQYTLRVASRASLPYSLDSLQGGKPWIHVQPLSNASIPQDFKTA